ncbi:bifunctional 2-polyprenyl-6-hydroxyphenol methylase/3-demethylubiquinol 3-O-methyltransferase UbiG [Acidisoma cellulosilytica]|uniref:Ubiquinone biosynthesis O-methyltransferase n=1 Tax=Acidisoma cellulosilyticum TaxID=2802395 RepID=A0A963Z314_9PROT|nr:bifunctional 2-polyprenyl-6-hydroxyphenol methylase/3-demethylubiquinol 3-O-methyltransferase UbiG [Acidisoma cellulosilyticum]MCB8880883.1 bifunctional 2-polyprenyl-6-hydroxyphenol methylase/3-demethylubiquinol 3-O-methyltransferase UbiG [Acidisoma cellulosilyticum]
MQDGTLSDAEIARFDALAEEWWAPKGPMAPLHQMNPLRADWVEAQTKRHFAGIPSADMLDIGCGAGLLSEALAKKGFSVLGLDAAPAAIRAAETHAEGQNLPLRYRLGRLEDVLGEGHRFPVVTALEVIEHIPEPQAFMHLLAQALAPGGMLFVSTLNRTIRSLLTAKIGAEYIARLLPAGTHSWQQFIAPKALSSMAGQAGLRTVASAGMSFNPWRQRWVESRDLSINYILAFCKD